MYLEYNQPSFYHFNDDSTWLARTVNEHMKPSSKFVLDLFAGSGVVGLELYQLNSNIESLYFLEKQEAFRSFLVQNVSETIPQNNYEIIIQDFKNWTVNNLTFDLIIANPPYFNESESRLSPDINKRLCRHQIGFSWKDILSFAYNYLKDEGEFYFLSRENEESLQKLTKLSLKLVDKKSETNLFIGKRLNID